MLPTMTHDTLMETEQVTVTLAESTLKELIQAANDAAEIMQINAKRLESRGENSSLERLAVLRLNMAMLAVEEKIQSRP